MSEIFGRVALLRCTEMSKFKSQILKTASQNKTHTEDWSVGSHSRDNGHVTKLLSLKTL